MRIHYKGEETSLMYLVSREPYDPSIVAPFTTKRFQLKFTTDFVHKNYISFINWSFIIMFSSLERRYCVRKFVSRQNVMYIRKYIYF